MPHNVTDQTIISVSRESRVFRPSAEFQRQANLGSYSVYKKMYAESVNSPEAFWDREAKEHLVWRKPFKSVLQWDEPHAKWFSGGKLNVAENCLDRHIGTHRENKAAIIFEGDPAWKLTLAGSAASIMCSKYNKPAFIFKKMDKESCGSVRNPKGTSSVEAMKTCADFLITYGGHACASGFRVKNQDLEKFEKKLIDYF